MRAAFDARLAHELGSIARLDMIRHQTIQQVPNMLPHCTNESVLKLRRPVSHCAPPAADRLCAGKAQRQLVIADSVPRALRFASEAP